MIVTKQKTKFSIKDFFSKCDQIRRKLLIWPHSLEKCLLENFIFCEVSICMRMLKICGSTIYRSLEINFKEYLRTGLFKPECEKENTIPIQKKGDNKC